MNKVVGVLKDFASLLYPDICNCCDSRLEGNEKILCTSCRMDIPLTGYHHDNENPVFQLFWGRVRVEHATALFFFRKGSRYRKLIHALKYKGVTDAGVLLGNMLGAELIDAESYKDVEYIIPVPLHPKRQKERGYNQCDFIAEGISGVMNVPVMKNCLVRKIYNVTQTKKDKESRWENVSEIFEIKDERTISGRHILLVDDIITTGSTLEACASKLLEVTGVRVSIVALGHSVI